MDFHAPSDRPLSKQINAGLKLGVETATTSGESVPADRLDHHPPRTDERGVLLALPEQKTRVHLAVVHNVERRGDLERVGPSNDGEQSADNRERPQHETDRPEGDPASNAHESADSRISHDGTSEQCGDSS